MKRTFETEFTEFKSSLSQKKRALESLAAMLNKHGEGEVLFGINDQGEAIGVNIGNDTLRKLSVEISENIRPTVLPVITEFEEDEKSIIRVRVVGRNKPYSAYGSYLIRSGSENKKLEPELLKELIFSNSEEQIVQIESFDQELSFFQLKQLYLMHGFSVDDVTFARNTGLVTANGRFNQLAELLSDSNNCSIKVVRFSGVDKSNLVNRNEFGYKCLLLAMQQAFDYVCSFNETQVRLNGRSTRDQVKLFDEKCLREAWNNACLHTQWSKMIPPILYIFNDRIEIVSTGGLPVDYPLEDFYAGISHPVNRQLQKIMGQLNYVEQTGHGVPEIIKKYGREAFEITENHLKVTLRFPFELEARQQNLSGLSESEKKVFLAIKAQPYILTDEIGQMTNLGISRVNQIIRELKDDGKIRRVGSKKTGHWEVIE